MSIQFTDTDTALIAVIDKKILDEDILQALLAAVTEAVDRNPKPVILDISRVQFLPSLGIGTLVNLHSQLKKRKQSLLIAGIHPSIRQVLAVTRVDKIFDLNDSLDTAKTKLHPQAPE